MNVKNIMKYIGIALGAYVGFEIVSFIFSHLGSLIWHLFELAFVVGGIYGILRLKNAFFGKKEIEEEKPQSNIDFFAGSINVPITSNSFSSKEKVSR